MKDTPLRPFLKWAGGKRLVVPHLEPYLCRDSTTRLVEPFVGSAAVSLALHHKIERFVVNDANLDLVNVYEHLRSTPEAFIAQVATYFVPKNNTEVRYYALRDRFNGAPSQSSERAALFIYLNRHGYNGLCRYNQSGGFNVPFGQFVAPRSPEKELRLAAPVLSRCELFHGDFKPILDACGPGDAVYCDPPYVALSKTANFGNYSKGGFSLDDQQRLVVAAKEAASRGALVVISNHDTPESRELYRGAQLKYITVKRTISRDGANRASAGEVIAIYEPPKRRVAQRKRG